MELICETFTFLQVPSSPSKVTIELYRPNHTNDGIRRNWKSYFHHNAQKYREMIYEVFPELIQMVPQFWFRIQYGVHTSNLSLLRIISVQWYLFYSFSLGTEDSYCNWIHTITNYKCEKSKFIELNCHLSPPWKTGALRQSRLLLLEPDFSKLFPRAASIEARLAGGHWTEKCFSLLQQDSLALPSSYSFWHLTKADCNKGHQV